MDKPYLTKISIVNYTNTLPFRWGLKKSTLFSEIELHEDIPSECARKLVQGEVHVALLPVAALSGLKNYHLISNYCIGANGSVDSVKLYSSVPLEKVKAIQLDYQSRSSIVLTRILCHHFWKIQPQFIDAKPGFEKNIKGDVAAVVIGDRTFKLNDTFEFEYDLSEQWKKFTGLPFVFAAWVSLQELPKEFCEKFNAALMDGVNHLEIAIHETPLVANNIKLSMYLKDKIDYHLDNDKRKAMQLFLAFIEGL